jgi:hypothetical protein
MRAPGVVAVVVPGDADEGRAVPAVAQEDVVTLVPRPDDHPEDVVLVRGVVGAQDGAAAAALRRGPGPEGEVPAVGGAAEEHVGGAVARDAVHAPRRAQRRALRARGDTRPVPVGVEVRAVDAAPQPHVRPVGEELHRSPGGWRRCCCRGGGGRRRGSGAVLQGGGWERSEQSRAGQVFVARRLRFGADAGQFKATADGLWWRTRECRSVLGLLATDWWGQ